MLRNALLCTSAFPAWAMSFVITKTYLFIFKLQTADSLLERKRLRWPLPLLHEHALLSDHKDIPLYFQIAVVGQSPWGNGPPRTSASPAWACPSCRPTPPQAAGSARPAHAALPPSSAAAGPPGPPSPPGRTRSVNIKVGDRMMHFAESTHTGVDQRSKDITHAQQQRPEPRMVILTCIA